MRVFKLKNCKRVSGVHFSPDGRTLLAVGGYEAGQVDTAIGLDLATGAELYRVGGFVAWYAVDPALTRFVIAGERGLARKPLPPDGQWQEVRDTLWQLGSGPRPRPIYALAIDPSGGRLAYAYGWNDEKEGDDEMRYGVAVVGFDTRTAPVRRPTVGGVFRLAFDPTGTRLAGSGYFGPKCGGAVFDLPAVRPAWIFGRLGNQTRGLAFLPDGRLAVANIKTVTVYREGGEPQFTLAGHKGQVNGVAVGPDGRRVWSASHDGTVRAWDTNTGAEVAGYDWKIGAVTAVAVAPDGLTAAAGSATGRVVVWDIDG